MIVEVDETWIDYAVGVDDGRGLKTRGRRIVCLEHRSDLAVAQIDGSLVDHRTGHGHHLPAEDERLAGERIDIERLDNSERATGSARHAGGRRNPGRGCLRNKASQRLCVKRILGPHLVFRRAGSGSRSKGKGPGGRRNLGEGRQLAFVIAFADLVERICAELARAAGAREVPRGCVEHQPAGGDFLLQDPDDLSQAGIEFRLRGGRMRNEQDTRRKLRAIGQREKPDANVLRKQRIPIRIGIGRRAR